jgi:AraC family ethanolamine operon transcriptional activator
MHSDPTRIHRWQTQDIDDQSVLLSGWNQEYRQLSCGKFIGNVSTADGPQVRIVGEHTNQSLHQRVTPPAGQLVFGLVLNSDDALQVNRHQVSTTSMIAVEGGKEYDFRTTGSTELLGISLDRNLIFGDDGAHVALIENALRQGVVALDPTAATMLRHLWLMMAQILAREAIWPSSMPMTQLASTALNNVLLALNMSSALSSTARSPAAKRQAQVVQEAIRFMRAHLDREFTIADVCAATHVSQRTLQYHFESSLEMSPLQYLKAMRLNAARSLIRKMGAAGNRANIAEIAAQCGYEHPSRFAGDYRRQFGALPSETLREATRHPAAA